MNSRVAFRGMKQLALIGMTMMAFGSMACAATREKAGVQAVRAVDRTPLDYELMFNVAHWQFTIHQHSVRDVKVSLYLDGKELLTTGLYEQHANSAKPHTLDIAIAPVFGSLLVQDKWQFGMNLRGHACFSYVIPRPRGTESMDWEGDPPPREIASGRFKLARFFDAKDTGHRHPRHLVLQIRINRA